MRRRFRTQKPFTKHCRKVSYYSVAFRGPEMNCPIDGKFLNDFISVTLRHCGSEFRIQTVGFVMETAHLVSFLTVRITEVIQKRLSGDQWQSPERGLLAGNNLFTAT
jgi:hypothetical protein